VGYASNINGRERIQSEKKERDTEREKRKVVHGKKGSTLVVSYVTWAFDNVSFFFS
jgi:hypothetical protein